MSTEANKALVRRLVKEVVHRGNFAVIPELAAPDFVEHAAPPGMATTREGIAQIIGMQRTAFPGLHSTEEAMIAEGELVMYRGTLTGTNTGPLMGMPPTGKPMTMGEMHVMRVRDGKLVEHWALFDLLGMMQQLGHVPAPGAPVH